MSPLPTEADLACGLLLFVARRVWPGGQFSQGYAAIADSSGSNTALTMSRSFTTAVSSKPRVGSAIDIRIRFGIWIAAKSASVYPRCPYRGFRQRRTRYESASPNWAQFGYRYSVTRNGDRLTCLHVSQDCCGIDAELALGNLFAHKNSVALCSNLEKLRPLKTFLRDAAASRSSVLCPRTFSAWRTMSARRLRKSAVNLVHPTIAVLYLDQEGAFNAPAVVCTEVAAGMHVEI